MGGSEFSEIDADEWLEGVVRVVGTLEVGAQYSDGYLLSIYRMQALQLDPLR